MIDIPTIVFIVCFFVLIIAHFSAKSESMVTDFRDEQHKNES